MSSPTKADVRLILVVDDDESVRTFTKLALKHFGFEAIEAEDGPAAIEIVRAQSAHIGAVILDLTMPCMDGVETLSALRQVAPDVPVILVSGFGTSRLDDVAGWLAPGTAPEAVLRKPFTPEELLSTLQRVMKPPT
ncbi:MAG: response regulator [Polyangia bacterium]